MSPCVCGGKAAGAGGCACGGTKPCEGVGAAADVGNGACWEATLSVGDGGTTLIAGVGNGVCGAATEKGVSSWADGVDGGKVAGVGTCGCGGIKAWDGIGAVAEAGKGTC